MGLVSIIGSVELDFTIQRVEDAPEWKRDARKFGREKANSLAMKRIFNNPHYVSMKKAEQERQKWEKYVKNASSDELVETTRDLFELVENELNGKIVFTPGIRVWTEGIYQCVDVSGEGNKGYPISWNIKNASKNLWGWLYNSSDAETELWRRINWPKKESDKVNQSVVVFGNEVKPKEINKYFIKYHRNFHSHYNHMPQTVESAFNHMPSVNRPLEVEGFSYPHPISKMVFA